MPESLNTLPNNEAEKPTDPIQERIREERRLGMKLMAIEPTVLRVIPYEDTNKLELEDLSRISKDEVRTEIEALIFFNKSPVIIDSIEDNQEGEIDAEERNAIRLRLTKADPELYHFLESNKLQKSNVMNILHTVGELKGIFPLSDELSEEYNYLMSELIGDHEGASYFNSQYGHILTNEEKKKYVDEVTAFTEKVIQEVIRNPYWTQKQE